MKKQRFIYRIMHGAYDTMNKILKYGAGQVDSRIDGKVCRITDSYPVNMSLKEQYLEEYTNDHLNQVKIIDIEEPEFLVLQSLLVPLDEVIIVES